MKLVDMLRSNAYHFLPGRFRQDRFFGGYFSGDELHTLCFLALLQPWTRDGERHRQAPPTTGRVSGIPKHANKKAFFPFSIVHAMHNRSI